MERQAALADAGQGITGIVAAPRPPAWADQRVLRLLTVTTLDPNAHQPNHGVFVENRLRHLIASHPVDSVVVHPGYSTSGRTISTAAAVWHGMSSLKAVWRTTFVRSCTE